MEFKDHRFADAQEVVDGNQYFDCTFDNCKIIYRGGAVPSIGNCAFNGCTWHFEEAAVRTLVFLRLIYNGMGEGGHTLVESAINQIREPMQANN
jgi:hypothetical protein